MIIKKILKKEKVSDYFKKEEVLLALKILSNEKEMKSKLVSDEIEILTMGN